MKIGTFLNEKQTRKYTTHMKSDYNVRKQERHSNKVYQALECLPVADLKRLHKYLASPYFNQSKTLLRLFEYFEASIARANGGFDRRALWSELFPGEPYDDVNFRKYCSDLLKLIEDFMANEIVAEDPVRQKIDTLDYVVNHKIEPLYNGVLRQSRTLLEKQPYRSMDYYRNAYEIERLYYSMMDFDVKINVRANIEEISRNLDLFYWIEKIKLYSAVLSQRKTGNHTYDLHFVEDIRQYLTRFPLQDVPGLAVYYYSLLTLLDEDNVENYYNLRRMLDEYGSAMSQREAIELFDSALHYCTGKLNKGDRSFLQEYFDLFEQAIQKGIFLVNGELASWRLNNVIVAALRLGKLDWAENFVQTHRLHLPEETRENTYSFNLARVYLYQKKYDRVLDLLRNVEYEDIGYNLISKTMLTITYYELDEIEALDSFLESFRMFLNRHKNIPQQRRQSYLNLLKYVRKMTRLAPGDKAARDKLRTELVANRSVTVNYEWLVEKLEELG